MQVEIETLATIVGDAHVSQCCGAEVLSAPDTEQMVFGYRCFNCDKETMPVAAWIVSSVCPEHGEHLLPIGIGLLQQDARN